MALAVSALIVAACGGEDDEDSGGGPATTAPAATTVEPTDTTTAEPATEDDDAAAFPVAIEHKYGSTTIEAQPERVVSVGFADQDAILALGVVPVGIRDWYGDQPNAVWPWATDELGDATTEVLSSSELNFEQIRALDPDVIVGLTSGMTDEEYETLSQIAPTVPQSDEYIDYGVPWQVVQTTIGQALGKSALAEQLVADTEQLLADVAAEHPEWDGKELAIAYEFDGQVGAYASGDGRPRLMSALGFVTPQEYDELAGDLFFSTFSWEEVSRLDKDLVMWISSAEDIVESIKANPLRGQLVASQEGREIFLDPLEAGAFSFASVLSIPYLVDVLVPQIEAAMDADPATSIPAAG
jgi:iron complex transport system substrate-binding protein